jgi:hypothetical protein
MPTDGTGSEAAGSAAGDVLGVDACTTEGVLSETTLREFPEQPKIANRKPVDTNKKTVFISCLLTECSSRAEGCVFLSLRFLR